MSRRTGPRTDRPDARGDILRSARELFASNGFKGTTMRAIAQSADVDVALISYYFGNKDGLFAASLELPVDPSNVLSRVFSEGLDGVGERILRTLTGVMEDETTGPAVIGLIRSAIADNQNQDVFRDFILNVVLEGYARHLQSPDAHERATLAASQVIGIIIGRYVFQIDPLARMSVDDLVAHVAPTLQDYLTGTC